jgi:nitroimidazol reductase NimA-like FMN-containing flavoprotein (pyridoxamine 5'-phosphate oxidase superfamily)
MTVHELSGDECRSLIESQEVGRLAVIIGGYPEVFPVNYAIVRDRIVVRTDPGAKLARAQFERVCFQVDDLDRATRTGWSVLIKGVVHRLDDTHHLGDEIARAAQRIAPWVGSERRQVLVITPVSTTGRRIGAE